MQVSMGSYTSRDLQAAVSIANLLQVNSIRSDIYEQFSLLTIFISDSGGFDIFLLKYDSTGGSLLWTQQTGSVSDDYALGVAVSGDGLSVYVTGYTNGSLIGQSSAGRSHDSI